jgi:hypothetical protein
MKISTAALIFFIGVVVIVLARYFAINYDYFVGAPVRCGFKTLGSYKLTTTKSDLRAAGAKGLIYISDLTSWDKITHSNPNDTTYSYTDFTPTDASGTNVKTLINNLMGCNSIPEFSGTVGINTKTALILCLQSTTTPGSRVFFVKCFVPTSNASDSNVIVGEIAGNTIAAYSETARPVAVIQGAVGVPNITDTYTLSYTLCVSGSRPHGFSYMDCCNNLVSGDTVSLISATYYPSDTTEDNATYKDNMKSKMTTYFTNNSKTISIPFTWNAFGGDTAPGKPKKLNIKYRCSSSSTVLSYTTPVTDTVFNSAGVASASPTQNIVLNCSVVTSTPMETSDLRTPSTCADEEAAKKAAEVLATGTATGAATTTSGGGSFTTTRDPNCKAGKYSAITSGPCTGSFDTELYKKTVNQIRSTRYYLRFGGGPSWFNRPRTNRPDADDNDTPTNNDDDTANDTGADDNEDAPWDIGYGHGDRTWDNERYNKRRSLGSHSNLSAADIARLKILLANKNSPNEHTFPQKYHRSGYNGSESLKPGLSDCQKYYNCTKQDDEEEDYEGQC